MTGVRKKLRFSTSAFQGEKAENYMTYIVTENCIKCKYMDCVEVCPVDCCLPDPDRVETEEELLAKIKT